MISGLKCCSRHFQVGSNHVGIIYTYSTLNFLDFLFHSIRTVFHAATITYSNATGTHNKFSAAKVAN